MLLAHATHRPVALRTSGSTGAPRSVVRSTQSWFASFEHVARLTGLGRGSRLWLPGPLAATMNLFAAVLARQVGATAVTDPADATHAHLTPAALERLLDDRRPLPLHLTVAGDRLPTRLRERAEAAGATVDHYYGASELSFVAWGTDERDLRAFPEVELVVDDGEIWVRSPYLCDGYDGPPGPLRWRDDGFATVGDRGSSVDGHLVVTGRGADAVVTGGATVLVSDVEPVLRSAAGGHVVVVGVPHPTLGQVVAAALTDSADLVAVRAAGQQRLTPPQRPRHWFHVPVLPLTGAGKVDRSALLAVVTGSDAVRLSPVARSALGAP